MRVTVLSPADDADLCALMGCMGAFAGVLRWQGQALLLPQLLCASLRAIRWLPPPSQALQAALAFTTRLVAVAGKASGTGMLNQGFWVFFGADLGFPDIGFFWVLFVGGGGEFVEWVLHVGY